MNDNEALLYSIVLILTPTRETTIRATVGHQAHAAFLRTVRKADPALAEVLHAPNLPTRPFTVSPLQGVPRAHDGQVRLAAGQDYWLRFTVLYPPLFERFMARFLEGKGRPILRLGRTVLLIKEILSTPGSHPWAGYTSWARLAGGATRSRRQATRPRASTTTCGPARRRTFRSTRSGASGWPCT